MCSVNDSDIDCESLIPLPNKILKLDCCRKCQSSRPSVILQKKDVYCKDCFIYAITHKCRSTIGITKLIKASDNVLVGFSGGLASMALIHMLRKGFDESSHKKLAFSAECCYIDESAVLDPGLYNAKDISSQIIKVVESLRLKCHVLSLEHSLAENLDLGEKELVIYRRKICDLFKNLTSMTAQEELLRQLRQKLLVRLARKLECDKIFTAEVGTRLAVQLLAGVSEGRGGQMEFEVGTCDYRHEGIPILRPLRRLTSKEVAFYNVFSGLPLLGIPTLTTMASPDVSITKLTEAFVSGLQQNFPSTIYTLYQTGEKLRSTEGGDELCALCEANLTASSSTCSAVNAVDFSKQTARQQVGGQQVGSCCGSSEGCCSNKQKSITKEDLARCLCYGCQLIFKDLKSTVHVPDFLVAQAKEKLNLENMRNQISEFLL